MQKKLAWVKEQTYVMDRAKHTMKHVCCLIMESENDKITFDVMSAREQQMPKYYHAGKMAKLVDAVSMLPDKAFRVMLHSTSSSYATKQATEPSTGSTPAR